MLSHNPAEVHRYTHVILDEAHERSADQDFLFLVLKRLLFAGASPSSSSSTAASSSLPAKTTRLVVMSATLQSSLFGEYFSTPGGGELDRREEVEPGSKRPKDHRMAFYSVYEGFKLLAGRFEQFQFLPGPVRRGRSPYSWARGASLWKSCTRMTSLRGPW